MKTQLTLLRTIQVFVFAAALTLGMTPAFAASGGGVDDPLGPFQLEGNVTTESGICFQASSAGAFTADPTSGSCNTNNLTCPSGFSPVCYGGTTDDWQNALAFGGGTSHALATSFVGPTASTVEPFNSSTDNTFFGGSKDTNPVDGWIWNLTTTPDKDDIEHAFAAAYTAANGHTFIYFGMDRYSNSGDQAGGFWFFQDSTVDLSSAKKGGGFAFTGHHSNKDLLIVSDFSQGGAISSIVAYEWICTGTGADCDSTGSLQVAAISPAPPYIECDPLLGTTPLCAVVNGTGGLSVPFGFTGKSSASGFVSATTYAPGELLEGGIDLNAIFGSNIPCFTRFMAETRSSTSVTSSLQDLTKPVSFPLCGLGVTKACTSQPGTISADGKSISYSYSATITNTGIGGLYSITLNDTLPDGTTQSFTPTLPDTCSLPGGGTALCLAAKHSVTVTGIDFTATSSNCKAGVTNCPSPLSATNTATAVGFTAPNSGGDEVDSTPPAGTATCTTPVTNTVSVKKACDAANGGATLVDAGSQVVVKVFYTARVCNTGQSQLTNITLVDHHDGDTDTPNGTGLTLNAGQCTGATGAPADLSGSYFPNAIDNNTGRFGFVDTISITSATATLGSNPTPPNPNPCATVGSSSDLSCDTITCPICYDNVCTGNPQPSNF